MSPRHAEIRGTTLVETLVYSSLLALVMGIVYAVLVMGLGSYRAAERSAELQHQAMVGASRMVEDLAGCPAAGVRVEGSAVVGLSARSATGTLAYDASGRLLWQGYVCYYLSGTDLVRKEQPISPTPDPPGATPAPASLIGNSSLPAVVVARDIASLTLLGGSGIELTVVAASPDGQAAVSVASSVSFRQ